MTTLYILTLMLWNGTEWVPADPKKYVPQEYDTIGECLQHQYGWNMYMAPMAEGVMGPNRAECSVKEFFSS